MVAVEIRPATWSDCAAVGGDLRQVEQDEVFAATGSLDFVGVSWDGVVHSEEAWAVDFDGEPGCIFGVSLEHESHLLGRYGCAWLLTTPLVEQYPKAFWRECLRALPELLQRWDRIFNWIDPRHEQAIRWGLRLGFRFDPPESFGPLGVPFQRFTLTMEDHQCARRQ